MLIVSPFESFILTGSTLRGGGAGHLWQGEGFVSAEHRDVTGPGDRSVPKGRTDPCIPAALGLLALPCKVGSSSGKQLGGTRRGFPPPALQRMAIAALSPPLPRCAGPGTLGVLFIEFYSRKGSEESEPPGAALMSAPRSVFGQNSAPRCIVVNPEELGLGSVPLDFQGCE